MTADEIIRLYEDSLVGADFDGLERALHLMYESGDPDGRFNNYLREHDSPALRHVKDEIVGRELEDASLQSLGGVIPRDDYEEG